MEQDWCADVALVRSGVGPVDSRRGAQENNQCAGAEVGPVIHKKTAFAVACGPRQAS